MTRRINPCFEHTCHVCGTRYAIRLEYDDDDGSEPRRNAPARCPCCDAEERHALHEPRHAATMLVATHYGDRWHRQQFGSAEQFLHTTSRSPADVDACLALVADLDLAAWQQQLETALRNCSSAPDRRELRDELAAVKRAGRAAARGALLPELRRIGAAVRDRLEQEHAHHLALYTQRCGDAPVPRLVAQCITGYPHEGETWMETLIRPDPEFDPLSTTVLRQRLSHGSSFVRARALAALARRLEREPALADHLFAAITDPANLAARTVGSVSVSQYALAVLQALDTPRAGALARHCLDALPQVDRLAYERWIGRADSTPDA